MSELARGLSDADAARRVTGCPGWDVHDLHAHAAGVVVDVMAGRVDGAGSDEWTYAQVAERKGVPLPAILDEWAGAAATFEPTLDGLPKPIWRTLLIDLVTHEHDARGALGVPGGRDTEAYAVARKGFAVGLAKAIEERGLPGLRLEAPDWSFDAGPEPSVTVRADDSFEFFRMLSGRRGVGQV